MATTSGVITTTDMSPAVKKYFSRGLLATPTPNLIHTLGVEKRTMPKNSGSVMRMKRYERLATATTPLGNSGVDPAPASVTTEFVDAEIQYYAQWIKLNEQVQLTVEDDVLNSLAIRLGVSMRETEDELTRNVLAATATVVNCRNGSEGDVPTEITERDIYDVTTRLRHNNAQFVTDNIEGQDKYGTAPVRDAFLALTSTAAVTDLNVRLDNFINKNRYSNANMGLPSEEGSLGNVRFFVSSKGYVESGASTEGADVYSAFIMGKDAATIIKQDGYSSEFVYGKPQPPLFQNATLGWKMAYAGRVTNDQFIANLRFILVNPLI